MTYLGSWLCRPTYTAASLSQCCGDSRTSCSAAATVDSEHPGTEEGRAGGGGAALTSGGLIMVIKAGYANADHKLRLVTLRLRVQNSHVNHTCLNYKSRLIFTNRLL